MKIDLTPHEAYAAIRKHFAELDPETPWAVSGINCVYRSEDGEKCAVGCLISDEDVAAWEEATGRDITTVTLNVGGMVRAGDLSVGRPDTYRFLKMAQEIHDRYAHGEKPYVDFLKALEGYWEGFRVGAEA